MHIFFAIIGDTVTNTEENKFAAKCIGSSAVLTSVGSPFHYCEARKESRSTWAPTESSYQSPRGRGAQWSGRSLAFDHGLEEGRISSPHCTVGQRRLVLNVLYSRNLQEQATAAMSAEDNSSPSGVTLCYSWHHHSIANGEGQVSTQASFPLEWK